MINIGEYIVSDDTIEKMSELLERTKIDQIEYGGIIYVRISDNNLILKNTCAGNDHRIKMIEVPIKGHDIVGDYHVHIDTELPSFLDLDPMKKGFDQLTFIGGCNTNKIKCYMLKNGDIYLLNGLAKLERIFYEFAQKSNINNKEILIKEFREIHDPSMKELLDKYYDVIEIK